MVNQSLRSGTPCHKEHGFTLVELILVIGLLAISVGVTNDVLISLIRTSSKTQIINEIEQQANFVSLKIEKELRNAKNATVDSGTILSFETRNGDVIEYKVYSADSGGIITRTENGGIEYDLTWDGVEGSGAGSGGVLVTCPGSDPICFSVTGTSPQIVSISMTFSQSQTTSIASFSGSVDINNSIVIRSTY